MKKVKITPERIQDHFQYGKLYYGIGFVVIIILWSLIYPSLQYRPDPDKSIDIFIVGNLTSDTVKVEQWEQDILGILPEDQEAVIIHNMVLTDSQEQNQDYLFVRTAAKEGDIIILPVDLYDSMGAGGAFIPLDKPMKDGTVPLDQLVLPDDLKLEAYRLEYDALDENNNYIKLDGICGLPLDDVKGLLDLETEIYGGVITVTAYSQNQENALKVINWLYANKLSFSKIDN